MRLAVAIALAVMLLAGACSGSGEVTVVAPPSPSSGTALPDVVDLAPDLAYLGDLADLAYAPVAAEFDSRGGSLVVSEQVTVWVPADSFVEATEVRAAAITLAVDRYATMAPQATIYRLSTNNEVALASPVILEIAMPSADLAVSELVDGEWRLRHVPAGATTRVEVPRFSDVTIAAVERTDVTPSVEGDAPQGQVAGEFLTACIYTMAHLLSSSGVTVSGEVQIDELGLNLAYSFCVRALISKFSPSGVRVEVSCVGDAIGGEVGLIEAIDVCAGEQTNQGAPDEPADIAPPEPQSSPSLEPSLTVVDTDVEFVGCPDPNFPNVCNYTLVITLDYVTPVVPSLLKCNMGLLGGTERPVGDFSGTTTVSIEYSVLQGSRFDTLDVRAGCSLASAGTENFGSVYADAVGERPDDDG